MDLTSVLRPHGRYPVRDFPEDFLPCCLRSTLDESLSGLVGYEEIEHALAYGLTLPVAESCFDTVVEESDPALQIETHDNARCALDEALETSLLRFHRLPQHHMFGDIPDCPLNPGRSCLVQEMVNMNLACPTFPSLVASSMTYLVGAELSSLRLPKRVEAMVLACVPRSSLNGRPISSSLV